VGTGELRHHIVVSSEQELACSRLPEDAICLRISVDFKFVETRELGFFNLELSLKVTDQRSSQRFHGFRLLNHKNF